MTDSVKPVADVGPWSGGDTATRRLIAAQMADPRCAVVRGDRGAVAAADPAAVDAGLQMLAAGGNAVDAAIAASAVLAVVAPEACGVGGDGIFLLRHPDGSTTALHGAGVWPSAATSWADDGGASVTVPGLVEAWCALVGAGRLPLSESLAPAVGLAIDGHRIGAPVVEAMAEQATRLDAGGAGDWALRQAGAGDHVRQPELGALLADIGKAGRSAFYEGGVAAAIDAAARRHGGAAILPDLVRHVGTWSVPLGAGLVLGGSLLVQPPPSQGVLLAMAARAVDRAMASAGVVAEAALRAHWAIEATKAAFEVRDRAAEGVALLDHGIDIGPVAVERTGGPRPYLHTAGIAAADSDGAVVSSLVSVFDDFGSGVFVPEGGFVLNNRAGGFTQGANAPRAGGRPIHTLAPSMRTDAHGAMALATPGADGQVQTLLQVLLALDAGDGLAAAVAGPRWRTQSGSVLIESGHPVGVELAARGHRLDERPAGDALFGAVVAAGIDQEGPYACADWRRATAAGAV
jgi:gamma-glutamyltranspeptidase/glutathione hydrolase